MGNKNTADNNQQAECNTIDVFEQLQSQFDKLVPPAQAEHAPITSLKNTELLDTFSMPNSELQSQNHLNKHQQPLDEKNSPDLLPEKHEATDTEERATDKVEPSDEDSCVNDQNAVANTPDKSIPMSIPKDFDQQPEATREAPRTPASTIMMLALAVAILMAAIAGTIWTLNDSSPQQANANDRERQTVLIKKEPRAGKYISTDPSLATNKNQSKPHASKLTTAQSTTQQTLPQDNVRHDNIKPSPVTIQNGDWVINLVSFHAIDNANAYIAQLKQRGIHTDMVPVTIKGKSWYRIRTIGFASKQDAEKQQQILARKLKLNSAWVSKSHH